MPDVRSPLPQNKKIVGVFCSDIHLSHRPPVARSVEDDWYEAMGRQLDELRRVGVENEVPIFIAGDIFDRWNPPPELINFAIRRLPKCYAIPGQHDLPFHSLQDIRKSAYWTLVEAGVITNLEGGGNAHCVGSLVIHAFPWGTPLAPCPTEHLSALGMNVALVHMYLWKKNRGYPGAPKEKLFSNLRPILSTYDSVFVGDNHIRWRYRSTINCGGFFRRKSDEVESQPAVYLLRSDGFIEERNLDVTRDKFLSKTELDRFEKEARKCGGFVEELSSLEEDAIDFKEAMGRFMDENRVSKGVREWVVKSMEE